MAKRCSTCGAWYPRAEGFFDTNGKNPSGSIRYRSNCKACEKKRAKEKRDNPVAKLKNKEKRKLSAFEKQKASALVTSLTEVVKCGNCSKSFIVTVLPEMAGKIQLTCKGCLSAIAAEQQTKENEHASIETSS